MSIEVNQLYKSYGAQPALNGISFTARPGRVLGFLGPNGAGKSTTMKILSGSIPPTSGAASLCGVQIQHGGPAMRRHLGYLPENNPLYAGLYVREALAFLADIHRIPNRQARIADVIDMTGLAPMQHRKINQLSKGYRQRVGLAQAILHDPDVLILDEPTSGLDPNQLQDMRSLIKQLGRQKTVLLSTHIMQEVEAICDDVVIIHQGKIIAAFPFAELGSRYPDKGLEALFIRLTVNK
ncbi:ATP-binding cassette domain-containing protein [Parapedobacter deserti]|uniref:ATP-binding cassette domain-containing protein n=1 Tax=Parapedobacter deserti TaxID=1912957 RepID=A0ABV7JJS4_9SPHI